MNFIERTINQDVQQHLKTKAIPDWIGALLARRVHSIKEADALINASLSSLSNPNDLPDMAQAIDLLTQAVNNNKHILCVVDYDTDGICSGAILQEGIRALGGKVEILVTNRHEDGYGFSLGACNKVLAMTPLPDLLITADLGSSDGIQVERLQAQCLAQNHSITVIITDHHHISATTPPKTADAFINPHRTDTSHNYDHPICGAMVAWNLVAALRSQLKPNYDVRQLLDLAAIATVGDMVTLSNPINRAVVKYGLLLINRLQRPAWQLLVEQLGKDTIVREDTIGFQISPRINALSRMGDDGHTALTWLTTYDMHLAQQSWIIMNQNNDDRKDEQALCESLALEQAQAQLKNNQFIIVAYVPEANHGVVGLAAGRIAMNTGRPAIVFSNTDKGQLTGSARSILGYDIRDLLERTQTLTELISKYGGHVAAAGLTLNTYADLSPFIQAINQIAKIDFAQKAPEPTVYHDGELPIELTKLQGLAALNHISPFGQGFAQPCFMLVSPIHSARIMGKSGQHVKLSIEAHHTIIEAVWFNPTRMPNEGEIHRFIVSLGENNFRGKTSLQAMVLTSEHIIS